MYRPKSTRKFLMIFLYIIQVPSTAVSGLTANAAGPFSVNVSWDPLPEEDNPGILVNYEINYKTVGSENWLTEQAWSTEEPYLITGLEAFTSYTVTVTMVNLEGKGIAASVNVSTEEGGEFVYRQRSKTRPSHCCLRIPFGGKFRHFEFRQQ